MTNEIWVQIAMLAMKNVNQSTKVSELEVHECELIDESCRFQHHQTVLYVGTQRPTFGKSKKYGPPTGTDRKSAY